MKNTIVFQEQQKEVIERVMLDSKEYLILEDGIQNVMVVEVTTNDGYIKIIDERTFDRVLDKSKAYGENLYSAIEREQGKVYFAPKVRSLRNGFRIKKFGRTLYRRKIA